MKLKIKFMEWSAGLPVAMLNEKTAEKIGVHAKDRVSIRISSKKIGFCFDISPLAVQRLKEKGFEAALMDIENDIEKNFP